MDQLLELTERTDGGLNASPAKREQIAALVEELESYCPRNPLRSPLLYGDYEVRGWPCGAGVAGTVDCGAFKEVEQPSSALPCSPSSGAALTSCNSVCAHAGTVRIQAAGHGRALPLPSGTHCVSGAARHAEHPAAQHLHQRGRPGPEHRQSETRRRHKPCRAV